MVGMSMWKILRELQKESIKGFSGTRRGGIVRELDELVAGACIQCSGIAVKRIDRAFVTATDDRNEWVI